MIKGLINSWVNISKVDQPKAFSFYNFEGKSYYLCGVIPRTLSLRENEFSNDFFLAIEAFVNENVLHIQEKNVKLLAFNDNSEIIHIMEPTNFSIKEYGIDLEDDALISVRQMIDFNSLKGRKVLLENFRNASILPEKILLSTKKPDLTFTRKIEHVETKAFVPLDKVIGTGHRDYWEKSWLTIYFSLKRPSNILDAVFNPDYYFHLQQIHDDSDCVSFFNIDNRYYVSNANHRVTLAIIMGIPQIYASVSYFITDELYKKSTLKLINWRFKVDFLKGSDILYLKRRFNKEYDWEICEITLGKKSILLYNHQMLEDFCQSFETLRIGGLSSYLFRLRIKILRNSDDHIKRFFLQNYEILSIHKQQLIQDGIIYKKSQL